MKKMIKLTPFGTCWLVPHSRKLHRFVATKHTMTLIFSTQHISCHKLPYNGKHVYPLIACLSPVPPSYENFTNAWHRAIRTYFSASCRRSRYSRSSLYSPSPSASVRNHFCLYRHLSCTCSTTDLTFTGRRCARHNWCNFYWCDRLSHVLPSCLLYTPESVARISIALATDRAVAAQSEIVVGDISAHRRELKGAPLSGSESHPLSPPAEVINFDHVHHFDLSSWCPLLI